MKRQLARAAIAALSIAAAGLVAAPNALSANAHANAAAVCPAPAVGAARCHALVVADARGNPLATTSPTGYSPAQFHTAYGLPNTSSAAQTIAIVDAYDAPTIAQDLATYSSTFGLPVLPTCSGSITTSCFQKVNQSGNASPLPRKNAGWALEISLDVEIAHAICQNCKILLVEASSNSFTNLATAVNRAATMGANVISNSYGGAESSGVSSLASSYNHPGVAVTVSSGDAGFGVESPASFNTVVAVGGTTLNLTGGGSWSSETVWSGTGSGCSAFFNARSWQPSASGWAATGCGTRRGVVDVAADANPNTGASVYDTTRYQGQSGWFQVGGTSLSAPLIGAVYALAANSGSVNYPASLPYAHTASLHDVTSGSNGSCSTTMCRGAVGYDGPTGVGTPNGLGAF
jgi:subtilase family serine protease